MKPQQKALMIAAPNSGSGKTVVTLALLRALKMHDVDVRAAKAGPDYIDPAFHAFACGSPSVNLDPWAMSPARCVQLAGDQGGSHLLVESMMGLFDGAADGSGSGAQLANLLGLPVVLVIDAAKQSHSIAALVRGFRDHDRDLDICGVILNKVGSTRHEAMLRQALAGIAMPVLGAIHRSENLVLPERHLGLVQAAENSDIDRFISEAAQQITRECDLDLLMKCFGECKQKPAMLPKDPMTPGRIVSIARDDAFSFLYPHLLNDWRKQGAEITFFSPLKDEGPTGEADAVLLPGGYPELHASTISGAANFRAAMIAAKNRDALIYGECGGYMVLGESLIDQGGAQHKMLGMLDLVTSFKARKLHLGYRIARTQGWFFAGEKINAHEFHYTSAIKENGEALFEVCDALGTSLGKSGLRKGNVMGSYLHLIDRAGD